MFKKDGYASRLPCQKNWIKQNIQLLTYHLKIGYSVVHVFMQLTINALLKYYFGIKVTSLISLHFKILYSQNQHHSGFNFD